jgi:hypothetical protein
MAVVGLTSRVLRSAALLGAVFALAAPTGSRADLVFFKDGFVLEGKVNQEGTKVFEGGHMIEMGKDSFFVDDYARRMFFSRFHVMRENGVHKKDFVVGDKYEGPRRIIFPPSSAKFPPPVRNIVETTSFTAGWDRSLTYVSVDKTGARQVAVDQHLTILTPHYTRLDTYYTPRKSIWPWPSFYLTRELDPDMIRTLLSTHEKLKEASDLSEDQLADKRLQYFFFFLQAGWFDKAEAELERLVKELPRQKGKADAARAKLTGLRALQTYEDIKRAMLAGQHQWAQKQLADFAETGVEANLLGRITLLRKEYDTANDNLKRARKLLAELCCAVTDANRSPLLVEAAQTIGLELCLDNFLPTLVQRDKEVDLTGRLDRLETFLSVAPAAAERLRQGKKAEAGQAAEEVLAVAVSGWALGNKSADSNVEVALRLWKARQFVLSYQTTIGQASRQTLLTGYQNQKSDALSVEEVAQLIAFLPPPEHDDLVSDRPVEMQTDVPGVRRRTPYLLQLPPEYHPLRPYPVLIALRQGGERLKDMLDRWKDQAARNGYILVVPAWQQGVRGIYSFSDDEHVVVLDVLADLRRRFQVDSDRVFLTGFGEGGTMAYDMGLEYPDLFAGVLPMSGHPKLYTRACMQNAQYLPLYIVGGSHTGQPREDNINLVRDWVQPPRGYPTIYVEYKGRGLEWFPAELPYAFDWMNRKKRVRPVTELGRNRGGEFQTMRASSNSFWWLRVDSLYADRINDPGQFRSLVPAKLDARNAANQIGINTYGVKQLTLRLTRDLGIDFSKPLFVNVNNSTRFKDKVTPSLETLLDDFYQRGDRQRLVVAQVTIKP